MGTRMLWPSRLRVRVVGHLKRATFQTPGTSPFSRAGDRADHGISISPADAETRLEPHGQS